MAWVLSSGAGQHWSSGGWATSHAASRALQQLCQDSGGRLDEALGSAQAMMGAPGEWRCRQCHVQDCPVLHLAQQALQEALQRVPRALLVAPAARAVPAVPVARAIWQQRLHSALAAPANRSVANGAVGACSSGL